MRREVCSKIDSQCRNRLPRSSNDLISGKQGNWMKSWALEIANFAGEHAAKTIIDSLADDGD